LRAGERGADDVSRMKRICDVIVQKEVRQLIESNKIAHQANYL
jgi:hypothetical protein